MTEPRVGRNLHLVLVDGNGDVCRMPSRVDILTWLAYLDACAEVDRAWEAVQAQWEKEA